MDHGGGDWAPYRAAQRLTRWAAENWDLIDGKLALVGTDPFQLPWRRVLNLAYVIWREQLSPEGIEALDEYLASDEENVAKATTESDHMARRTAGALGANVEGMFDRMMRERQAVAAQRAREAAQQEVSDDDGHR